MRSWIVAAVCLLATIDAGRAGNLQNLALRAKPQPLPEIHFKDETGQSRTLADFRGKVVLLNIWATWCIPCRKEMPTLDHVQATLGGSGFEVVALSIDSGGPEIVRKFFSSNGVRSLKLYIDVSSKAAFALATPGLPLTLLINRHGQEIGRLIGPAEWDEPDMIAFLKSKISADSSADISKGDSR